MEESDILSDPANIQRHLVNVEICFLLFLPSFKGCPGWFHMDLIVMFYF